MPGESLGQLLVHVRSLVDESRPPTAPCSDRQLLERFTRHDDQAAFTALVRRHGPLVLGVCRRVLRQEADAEDAFQAVFLVLARKARSVCWGDSVGGWLYGVAYRVAHKARVARARRQRREARAGRPVDTTPATSAPWSELQAVLDEELQHLPAAFRTPLVLCYLEGRTQDEAARQLGWSLGALRGRLWRGRELLRSRLARRGLSLGSVLVALALSHSAAPAAVPVGLAAATVQAAFAFLRGGAAIVPGPILGLTKGMLHTMFLSKFTPLAVILAVTITLAGIGLTAHLSLAEKPPAAFSDSAVSADAPKADEPRDKPKGDGEKPKDGDRPKEGPRDGDRPKEGPRDRGPGVKGAIKEVHATQKLVTVITAKQDGGGGGVEVVLDVADAKIVVAGQPAKLTDLQAGMNVFIQSRDGKSGQAVEASWPLILGAIKSVDPAQHTVTLYGGEKGQEQTYELAKDARVLFDGVPVRLEDLEGRTRVNLELTADRKAVAVVSAQGGKSFLRAYAVEVDPDKGTLTVRLGENQAELNFDVSKDANILLDGKPAKLGDVKPGAWLLLKLGADKRTIAALRILPAVREREGDR
jgi:RNA polymerase sigma factor (sigma-70 family)